MKPMVMVWLEIPVWLPTLDPVILNVCTLDFRSVHLGMASHVFTRGGQKTGMLVSSVC